MGSSNVRERLTSQEPPVLFRIVPALLRTFQFADPIGHRFHLDIQRPQCGSMAALPYFNRRSPFMKLGQKPRFESFQLFGEPALVFVR